MFVVYNWKVSSTVVFTVTLGLVFLLLSILWSSSSSSLSYEERSSKETTKTLSKNVVDLLVRKGSSSSTMSSSIRRELVVPLLEEDAELSCATPEWLQVGEDIDGEAANDHFGFAVALSADGTTMAVGARFNDGSNGSDSGSVRIFHVDNSSPLGWVQIGEDLDGEFNGDYFGWSVALSDNGEVVAVGGPNNDDGGFNSGYVKIFGRDTSSTIGWSQLGEDLVGAAADDQFGFSIALSGDGETLVVGTRLNDEGGSDAGQVTVYTRSPSSSLGWEQLGISLNGEASEDKFGFSVDISNDGTVVAVSGRRNDGNGVDSGHVRVFKWNASSAGWVQEGGDIDGESAYDDSGYSIALSNNGNILAIGARSNDGINGADSGHVRVYGRDTSTSLGWAQIGGDLDGENSGDSSGMSVALSADGDIIAISAPWNDGSGTDAGHVRVYRRDTSVSLGWVQVGTDIDSEAASDLSGWYHRAVALSANGEVLAIGAAQNDGNGSNSGHVRVFQACENSFLTPTPTPPPSFTQTSTPTSAPKECVDSEEEIVPGVDCDYLSALPTDTIEFACANAIVFEKCPLTCGLCVCDCTYESSSEECVDSEEDIISGVDCAYVSGLPTSSIEFACANAIVFETCPFTCGLCVCDCTYA